MSVAQLVRDGSRIDPSAVAITGDGRAATFGELESASNRAANALIASGVRRGDRVGFVDRNGTEYWETFLGALKAGAILVPLNFRLGADELAWSLADAEVTVIIAGAAFAPLIRPDGRPFVVIDAQGAVPGAIDYQDWLAAAPGTDPGRDAVGAELIELIYSSGTTGRPKGVLVSAEQQLWSVDAFGSNFDVDSSSRSLVPVPYYHVAGGGWALITLAKGGRIIQSREPTADSMLEALISHSATHTAMVPAVMQVLTGSARASAADFSALRQVVYGGSPISEPLLAASVRTFGADLFQSYGLSETMGTTTLLGPAQHRPDGDLSRLRSAGRAIAGIEIEIADTATGERLLSGSTGEILVRGGSLTPGYWRNPQATADAFTADGFFRTGDMGLLDDDGFLFIRDRLKDMIITGGENVYPAEVESVLAAFPGVLEVAVVGVPSERWGETPMAFVVSRGAHPDPEEVIRFSREKMAHFKCPTTVEFVEALPRNPSGKVLKRQLRAPYWP
ncbi:long-chain acyl-CoA synthetase [Nakamurella sp. UYEF19]|uniref:AMP-binding protein n=1 Tax=Nakamurella sp. UYEF19 TaxID=1756392 RepID=UPI00339B66AF